MCISHGPGISAFADHSLRITRDSADIHDIHEVLLAHGRNIKGRQIFKISGQQAFGFRFCLNVHIVDLPLIGTGQNTAGILAGDSAGSVLCDHLSLKGTSADQAVRLIDTRNSAAVLKCTDASAERTVQNRSGIDTGDSADALCFLAGLKPPLNIQIPDHSALSDIAEHSLVRAVRKNRGTPDGMPLPVKDSRKIRNGQKVFPGQADVFCQNCLEIF